MSEQYLTIPEASAYSGKPEITIRRLVKRVQTTEKEKEQFVKKQKKGKLFVYKISSILLDEEYGMTKGSAKEAKKSSNESQSSEVSHDDHSTISHLQKTILILEKQMEVKDRQLEKMQELVRNEQVLSLQQGRGKQGLFSRLFQRQKTTAN